MIKKRISIIALIVLLVLSLTFPVVIAHNEDIEANADDDVSIVTDSNLDSSEDSNEIIEQNSEENTLKKEDVYLTGDNVTIDYIVDGNLFVIANSVTIDSQIGGDAFILAKSVNVSEKGYIFSNMFVAAETVNIKGIVYDLYSVCKDLNISGYVYRDIKVSANSLNIFGTVGRNAFVNCEKLNFVDETTSTEESEENSEFATKSSGRIAGNLEYSSEEELPLSQENVNGSIKFTKIVHDTDEKSISSYIMSLAAFVSTIVLIWLVGLWLTPKFIKSCDNLLAKKTLPVIGLGLLTPIALIIAFIILLITGITSSFAILLLPVLFTLLGISSSITVISINNLICNKLKIEKLLIKFGILVISAIVTWLVCLIPILGGLISLALVILGTGIVVSNLVIKK